MAVIGRTSTPNHLRKRNASNRQNDKIRTLVVYLIGAGVCFYAGIMVGTQFGFSHGDKDCSANVVKAVRERLHIMEGASNDEYSISEGNPIHGIPGMSTKNESRFDYGIKSFAVGMSMVGRDMFRRYLNFGTSSLKSKTFNQRVLILHSGEDSLPSDPVDSGNAQSQTKIPFIENLQRAIENCETMNVILTQPGQHDQCIAIMGMEQYSSFHIQKFMRIPPDGYDNTTSSDLANNGERQNFPLRLVNRNRKSDGDPSIIMPTLQQSKDYWNRILVPYLNNLNDALEKLKPKAVKTANKKNTIIVMVANHGHSEFLLNFVCNAKAKDIDLKHILVFATDAETRELARGIGFEVFYDELNFINIPKDSAVRYLDRTFTVMMMAKIYCVHMINQLGYNVLFQDVDMLWYRNPLEYFNLADSDDADEKNGLGENNSIDEFDIYFQEDGNRGEYYTPYSANTGFYLVKYNERTRYFFNVLLMSGDLISATKSHQVALMSILSEHASMYGLRVKILPEEKGLFPSGYTYLNPLRKIYMKDLLTHKLPQDNIPYIFHMSWTHAKEHKEKYFKQMGQWYLKDECIQTEAHKIVAAHAKEHQHEAGYNFNPGYLQRMCCSAEPLLSCHFRDKPSMKSCSDSNPMVKNGPSFW